MPSANSYKKLIGGLTSGQMKKNSSDTIMNLSWDEDVQSRVGYLYTYNDYITNKFEVNSFKNLNPKDNSNKLQVDIKFIIDTYPSIDKDQVAYLIQFKDNRVPKKFAEYESEYGAEFPIGLYIDIPDDEGIYYRWLICSKEISNQFRKFFVLPCNYNFRWVMNNKYYSMWGVARLRNSYNSGVWRDYIFQTPENQDQIWFPLNRISRAIGYDQKFIMDVDDKFELEKDEYGNYEYPEREPVTWVVTKPESIHPIGIMKITLAQGIFNFKTDRKLKLSNDDGYYWYGDVQKPEEPNDPTSDTSDKIELIPSYPTIRANNTYRTIIMKRYTSTGNEIEVLNPTFVVKIKDSIVSSSDVYIDVSVQNQIRIRILNENLIDETLTIVGSDTDVSDYVLYINVVA